MRVSSNVFFFLGKMLSVIIVFVSYIEYFLCKNYFHTDLLYVFPTNDEKCVVNEEMWICSHIA